MIKNYPTLKNYIARKYSVAKTFFFPEKTGLKFLFLFIFLIITNFASGQTTLFQFNFENNSVAPNVNKTCGTPVITPLVANFGGKYELKSTASCGGTSMMLEADKWSSGESYRITVNTSGYETLEFSYCNKGDTGIGNFISYVSTDNGTTKQAITSTYTPSTTSSTITSIVLPSAANNNGLIYLYIQKVGNPSRVQDLFYVDDVTLTGTPMANGTVAPSTTVCSGSTSGLLTLSGHTGTIIKWQSSVSPFSTWTDIANTTATYTSGTLTATTQFRAVVKNGTCPERYSAAATVTVNPTSVGGTATPTASPICSGGSTIITLTGYTGSIQWQSNASGSFVNILSETSATYTTPVLTNTTSYRAIVTSGVCNSSTSSVAIVTVNPLPSAPIITNVFICGGSSATLVASGAITGQTYNWYTVASGGSSVNTTNSYNTPALTTTTEYWVAIVNSNGCESVRSMATAFVNVKNIWTGNANDENWNTAGNWCLGVPIESNPASLDVIIPKDIVMPDGSPNYPIIAAAGLSGVANNIEIQQGASVTIDGVTDILTGTGTGNFLTIKGDLSLNGKIDLNGESQLIQGNNSGLSGAGTLEINQQGTGNSFWYNYWSSPVTPVNSTATYTIKEVLRDGNGGIIDFDPSKIWAEGLPSSTIRISTNWMYVLRNSGLGYSAWYGVYLPGKLPQIAIGVGFSMKGSNTTDYLQNYTFVGKPNNGEIKVSITGNNHYLIGNPYPSAIDALKFIADNAPPIGSPVGTPGTTTGTIYFWEHYGGTTHYLSDYQGGYATYSYGGGLPASSTITGSGNQVTSIKEEPGQFIPVGQGFFVVADVGGDIIFKNSQRIFKMESESQPNDPISVFMKSSNIKAKKENAPDADLRPKFRIGFDAPKINHRQLLFTIDERATPAVDWGFDAKIYQVIADDMYWMLDGNKYVIQVTNEVGLNSEVPLGIQLSKTGVATVKIDALENVDDDTTIYLKDKVTGESYNMREKPVQLNLTAGKYADRFVLVFKTQKLVAEDVKAEILIPATAQPIIEGIHVFMNNAIGELQIKNNSTEEILSVALINAVGQTIKTWNSNFNIRTISLPLSTTTGVYLVQINTKTGKTVKKISVE